MALLREFGTEVWETFDATAAVDVALLALLIYLTLIALQRVRTGYALRGAVLVGGLYLVARQFNLALTSATLEGFLAVLVLALIMIYREELRRLVEKVAKLGRRRTSDEGQPELARMLAIVAFELAAKGWGALIVLSGDEPVTPHLSGGVLLGGEPSAALFKSIFDPSSQGHDGAVVIHAGVVSRFSAHLPLSENADELGEKGTRHAAALGLSERCDALCIVVSEELSIVSTAVGGKLTEIDDGDALAKVIAKHLGPRSGLRQSSWHSVLTEHHGTKVAALVMSAIAWLVLVYGGQPIQRSFATRVEWRDVAAGLSVARVEPAEVRIIATGARRDFALATRSPTRVVLTLADVTANENLVRVSPEDVRLPAGLSLKSVVPAELAVTVTHAQSAAPSASALNRRPAPASGGRR